jgi:hypothetical protein
MAEMGCAAREEMKNDESGRVKWEGRKKGPEYETK